MLLFSAMISVSANLFKILKRKKPVSSPSWPMREAGGSFRVGFGVVVAMRLTPSRTQFTQ